MWKNGQVLNKWVGVMKIRVKNLIVGGGVDKGAMWGLSEGRSCIQRRHTCKGAV